MRNALIIWSVSATAALAHPGHGEARVLHWLVEADHLLVVVLAGLAAVIAVLGLLERRRKARREP